MTEPQRRSLSLLPFQRETDYAARTVTQVAPLLRRIVAGNGGAMTYRGTNSYLVGEGEVALVDPGPDCAAHLARLLGALRPGERITHILVTHTHRDHTDGLAALRAATGALTCGAGSAARRYAVPARALTHIETGFAPDIVLTHGDVLTFGGGARIEVIATPGHAPDHLCLAVQPADALLSGDHVMGWNTTVIAPPEGHLTSYLASLACLLPRGETRYFPGHGGRIDEPQRLVKAFIMHRRWRENEIVAALADGCARIDLIVPRIYAALSPSLVGAAGYSVAAHLERLLENGRAAYDGTPDFQGRYWLVGRG